MPNVSLIPLFVMAGATAAAAFIAPFVLTFWVRRNRRTGCRQIGFYGILGAGIALLLTALIRFPLEAALTMPYVQEALDAQCGAGIQADPAFYRNDPNIAWLGDDAGCQYLGVVGGWECYCAP